MANVVETTTYEPGVYQLETTDLAAGGPAGISNRQGIQLANRTNWLKWAHDTGNYCGGIVQTDGIFFGITDAHAGKIVRSFGAPPSTGISFSLPDITTFPDGKSVFIVNAANQASATSRSVTLVTTGSNIIAGGYNAVNPLDIPPGYAVEICKPAGSSSWYLMNRICFDGERDHSGEIVASASQTTPRGYLACNGAAISRANYAALFAVIGTTFGAGNGSTTFNVPDLRGEFLRGLDAGRGVDPGRTFASSQSDSFRSHSHVMSTDYFPTSQVFSTGIYAGVYQLPGVTQTTQAAGGTETRPRNVAVNFFIKY